MKSPAVLALIALLCSVFSVPSSLVARPVAPADDWPQLRGPNANGISDEHDWSVAGEVLWKKNVGLGYASPSIAGDRLIIQGFDEASWLRLMSLLGVRPPGETEPLAVVVVDAAQRPIAAFDTAGNRSKPVQVRLDLDKPALHSPQ